MMIVSNAQNETKEKKTPQTRDQQQNSTTTTTNLIYDVYDQQNSSAQS